MARKEDLRTLHELRENMINLASESDWLSSSEEITLDQADEQRKEVRIVDDKYRLSAVEFGRIARELGFKSTLSAHNALARYKW